MKGERLTRYKLGIIRQMHDSAHYTWVSQEYLTEQLARVGLPSKVSRFQLAQRIEEIELRMEKT